MNTPPLLSSTNEPLILPDGLEVKTHGTINIPYTVYRGSIPDYLPSYPLHYHDELEIIYCISGSGCILISGESHVITSEDFVIILPDQVHSIESITEPFEYFNILFKFSIIESEREDNFIYQQYMAPFAKGSVAVPSIIKRDSPLSEKLSPHILPLIDEGEKISILLVKSHLYAIMDILNNIAVPIDKKSASNHKTNEFLRQAVQYINDYYSEKVQISEVSAFCGYSKSHFMKLFKDLTGTSFSQYLVRFRLEKAAALLRSTDKSIINIATLCGFFNASYFTRAFIKQYQSTPSEYRSSWND